MENAGIVQVKCCTVADQTDIAVFWLSAIYTLVMENGNFVIFALVYHSAKNGRRMYLS